MKQSLFDAVGGLATLQKVHKIFYDKVYAHDWLKQFFAGHDQQIIEDKQTSFMAEKMGCSDKNIVQYRGKPLKQAHENMYITEELYMVRHDLLQQSIAEAGVPEDLAQRWLKIDKAFIRLISKSSMEAFYRDYHFAHKQRIIFPKPDISNPDST